MLRYRKIEWKLADLKIGAAFVQLRHPVFLIHEVRQVILSEAQGNCLHLGDVLRSQLGYEAQPNSMVNIAVGAVHVAEEPQGGEAEGHGVGAGDGVVRLAEVLGDPGRMGKGSGL
ncbi:hypothetical protein TSACC_2920 [Terrimicrobium sacchariphilum]|uniref:Uncharacterized protein n=1 Tax=Terrimicrobium sacchariphilum TaxID=690879 RepID=A0A146G4J0_TERSA|nr:hypothetical protein [Terrimicrobium sacchariphilum]GAT32521.1 hypothetical protein TSACC_2920 [Terrimicrobium sacchariphilum]